MRQEAWQPKKWKCLEGKNVITFFYFIKNSSLRRDQVGFEVDPMPCINVGKWQKMMELMDQFNWKEWGESTSVFLCEMVNWIYYVLDY